MGCKLIQEYGVGDSVKSLAEVQIDNIHSPFCINQACHLVIKGDQVVVTKSSHNIQEVLPPDGSALDSSESIQEPSRIGSVGHGGGFWQLLLLLY
ncbi:hypothetical protein DUI87_23713 [Hirundo rustica rustica]|uniref:Uncharacterized protein n=1 Tax=Hirundo rustica rustica TaxID=333673 RepID=A0A3M0JFD4_HIRRU|nr:hypothetical protein DUI87_23713 [Hirundo rustica rustica]